MMKRDRKAIVQLKVRMREPLRSAIAKAAEHNGVSMNSEIVDRLKRSLEQQDVIEQVARAVYNSHVQ